MAFPSYTIADVASAQDVWAMFWRASYYLNGNIDFNYDFDFGLPVDFSFESKNIKSSKVKWDVVQGHDHGAASGSGPIAEMGLRKRHIDINTSNILWRDYFGSEWELTNLTVCSGSVSITIGGGNSHGYSVLPETYNETGSSIYPSKYDATSGHWSDWDSYTLGYIVSIASSTTTDMAYQTSLLVTKDADTGVWQVHIYFGTAGVTYIVNYLLFKIWGRS